MAEDDDMKNYVIYFIFIAVLTMIIIRLMKSESEIMTGIMVMALIATLIVFMKTVLGLNAPSLPKVKKDKE